MTEATAPGHGDDTGHGLRTRVRGVEVDVTFAVDAAEHLRRIEQGTGPQLRFRELATWLSIRNDDWSPVHKLDAVAVELIEAHPESVDLDFDRDGVKVRRLLCPTVKPMRVSVRTDRWRQGLEWAGRFAGYAERALVLSERPRDLTEVQLEAMYFGVGLGLEHDDGSVEVVCHSAPFLPERFTAASWYFAEQIYSRWLEDSL